MNHLVVKHEIDHRIAMALFRHRGDVYAVSKELEVDVNYVQRIFHKLKKRRERDVSYWLSSSIMQTIYEGYQQRIASLQRYLSMLSGKEQEPISICCGTAVTPQKRGQHTRYFCMKCKSMCEITYTPRKDIFQLFHNLIEDLRTEDQTLVSFAESMGFTNKEDAPIIKQNFFMLDKKPTVQIDEGVANEINKLTPREREHTRKLIESHILQDDQPVIDVKVQTDKTTSEKGSKKQKLNAKNKVKKTC